MPRSQSVVDQNLGAAIICAAFLLFTTFGFTAFAQASMRIDGQIFNGTKGAPNESIANLAVTLFQITSTGPITRTVPTDANGRFTFAGLSLDRGATFFTRVDYAGLHYFSDTVEGQASATQPISMTVYETQTLPVNFQIDRAHLILDVGQKQINGIELIEVTNASDRAFLLPLPIPNNATRVAFNDPRDESRAVRGADGSLAYPILPTTTQILFGVTLVTKAPEYALALRLRNSIARMNVLVSQIGDIRVSSPQLPIHDTFTTQTGEKYLQLSGNNIPVGSIVNLALSNLPGADNSAPTRNVIVAVGAIGALALLASPFFLRKRVPPSAKVALAETRLAQLRAIAALDDAFDEGAIAEDEYRPQRAELKAELMKTSTNIDE